MKNSINSNMYENSLETIWRKYAHYLDGLHAGLVVIVSNNRLNGEAQRAFNSSFARLGYGSDACTFLTLTSKGTPPEKDALLTKDALLCEGTALPAENDLSDGSTLLVSSTSLSETDVFSVLEGLDPLCVIATDTEASQTCAHAYREDFPLLERARLFGRDARAFASFETMLTNAPDKQKAWALLKSLPKIC